MVGGSAASPAGAAGPGGARWSAKWRAAAREAAKQSRRPFVPAGRRTGDRPPAVADLIEQAAAAAWCCTSRRPPRSQAADLPDAGDVVLIVGPEGGLTEEELTVFAAAGAVPVRLGPQVLRTSTAGAVALGALGVLTGRWT